MCLEYCYLHATFTAQIVWVFWSCCQPCKPGSCFSLTSGSWLGLGLHSAESELTVVILDQGICCENQASLCKNRWKQASICWFRYEDCFTELSWHFPCTDFLGRAFHDLQPSFVTARAEFCNSICYWLHSALPLDMGLQDILSLGTGQAGTIQLRTIKQDTYLKQEQKLLYTLGP